MRKKIEITSSGKLPEVAWDHKRGKAVIVNPPKRQAIIGRPITTAKLFTPIGYRENIILGVEFGFRCAEQGLNLEATILRARQILFETESHKGDTK
jgi:hypothetical protein